MQVPVIFGMLMTLLSNDNVTAKQLSEKYEISKRTVYRYINCLDEAGLPLYSKLGRNGGWSILPNYKLSSVYFTKQEYDRMLFNTTTSTISDSTNKVLLDKLNGFRRNYNSNYVLSANQLVVETHASDSQQQLLTTMQQAILGNRLVQIEYHGAMGQPTVRSIEPYSLVMNNGLWYVYGYCHLRQGWRYFRISRISSYLVQGSTFSPRLFSVDTSLIDDYALAGKQSIDITLSVSMDSRAVVEDWLGMSAVTEQGGSLIAKTTAVYDEWLINRILSLGSGVKVLHPSKLKNDIINHCQRIIDSYSN